jgi:flagellar motor switch protein FliM
MAEKSVPAHSSESSVRELFEAPKLALDRAPVLRGVFERVANGCVERMRTLCVPPFTFMLNAITVGSTWDMIEEYEDGICSVNYAPEWDARILIGFDRRCAFSIVEAMFGGDGTEPPYEGDRSFSAIEVRTMKCIFAAVAECLSQMLTPIDTISLLQERVEPKLDFSSIGISDVPAVMAQFIAQVFDGGGRMFVIVPQAALIPLRRKLERERSPEPPTQDQVWADKLTNEVGRADVQLDAIIEGPWLALDEIAQMRVNTVLRLQSGPDSLLCFECMGENLYRCRLGQSDGDFTVQIEHRVDQQQDLIVGLLSNGKPL